MAHLDKLDDIRTAIAKELRRLGVHPDESSWIPTFYELLDKQTIKMMGPPIWERQPKRWNKYKRTVSDE